MAGVAREHGQVNIQNAAWLAILWNWFGTPLQKIVWTDTTLTNICNLLFAEHFFHCQNFCKSAHKITQTNFDTEAFPQHAPHCQVQELWIVWKVVDTHKLWLTHQSMQWLCEHFAKHQWEWAAFVWMDRLFNQSKLQHKPKHCTRKMQKNFANHESFADEQNFHQFQTAMTMSKCFKRMIWEVKHAQTFAKMHSVNQSFKVQVKCEELYFQCELSFWNSDPFSVSGSSAGLFNSHWSTPCMGSPIPSSVLRFWFRFRWRQTMTATETFATRGRTTTTRWCHRSISAGQRIQIVYLPLSYLLALASSSEERNSL